MSPGGTTGMLVQGDGAQPSLPVLTDEDGVSFRFFLLTRLFTVNAIK